MPDVPPDAVVEALDSCRKREHEAKLGRELASKHTIVELLDQVPLAVNTTDSSELARRLDKAFHPFRDYCLSKGVERLDQVSSALWSHWIKDGLDALEKSEDEPHVAPAPTMSWGHDHDVDTRALGLSLEGMEAKSTGLY